MDYYERGTMKRRHGRISPYLLVFFLPVLMVLLVAAGIVLTSLVSMRQEYQDMALMHQQDTQRLALAAQFTHDLAAVQQMVEGTLDAAANGQIDQAGIARAHIQVLNKLSELEIRLQELAHQQVSVGEIKGAREDFEDYRSQIIRATDMALTDPGAATRDAFRASKTYIAFAEHTHAMAQEALDAMASRAAQQASSFQVIALRLAVMGLLSLLALLLLWFVALRKMMHRMALLAGTLEAMHGSQIDASVWNEVEAISREPRSLFAGSARAVLAYRDSVAARTLAQTQRDETQALMNAVFEQAASAINLIDVQSLRLVQVNAASARLLGYSRDELLGMTLMDFQDQLDESAMRARVQQVMANGKGSFDNRYRCRGGRVIDVRVDATVLRQHGRDYLVVMWDDVTEQKSTELTLRRLSMAVEQSPHAVVITDVAARIEFVNDAFCLLTGYSRDEVMGCNPRLLSAGKTPASTYREMWDALTAGQQWRGMFINRTKDGRERIESALIAPLRDAQGRVCNYVAIKEDITQRQQAEDELRKLYMAVEQSPESIVITNLAAEIEYVNQAFISNTGYSREEALGMNPRVLKSGHTPDETYQALWAALGRGEAWSGVLHNRRKDGSEYEEMATIAPVRQSDGRVTHYLAIKQDITEKRRMSQELEQYRAHLEELVETRTAALEQASEELRLAAAEQAAIFETATSGMALIKDRVLMRCNRRLHEIFDWPLGSMVGKRTEIWYADAAASDAGGDVVYQSIWQGQAHGREQQLMRRDGSLFWARLVGKAVDIEDRSKGTVWVIDDISSERATAQAMREAREMAEEAARTKANFLANMSHEIRTPMNAVIGMTHLMLKTELMPRQREYLNKIMDSGQHLLGIINDILDVSKIEAGKMSIEHVAFDLEKVLSHVSTLIAEKATAKGLELIFDVDRNVPTHLIGDPLRLSQILINYANNAIKFTAQGEVNVLVRVRQQSAQDVMLYFAVRDTGIGLTDAQRGQLFQSFQQADASTTRKFGGTGLGLAICKSLVDMMHGEVGVDSVLGEGSTFWFTALLGKDPSERAQRVLNADLQGRHVLVVDDNAHARLVLRDMLEGMGFVVEEAPSGKAALQAVAQAQARQRAFDLVFLDWQMPDMDGIETAQQLRSQPMQSAPHLVMVTAYGREDLLKGAARAGVADVLIKPVNASTLFDSVVSMLGSTQDGPRGAAGMPALTLQQLAGIRGARILLVEDNDLNQEVATGLLRDAGLVVDVAENGAVALNLLAQQDYELVLMDMQMPVMDGVTATQEIRKLPKCRDLPIVAMTANVFEADRERCQQAGMNDHLAKPIEPDLLWQTLLRWIAPRSLLSSAPAVAMPDESQQETLVAGAIDGLDIQAGLRHAMGKQSLYISLLQRFVDGQKETLTQLRWSLDNGDLVRVQHLAHTLKGVCGSIGAAQLQSLAGQLELAARAGSDPDIVRNDIEALAVPLNDMLAALQSALPQTVQTKPVSFDLAHVKHVCERLLDFLALDDAEAVDVWDDHAELLHAAFPLAYRRIDHAIKQFDFALALSLLRAAWAQQDR